MDNQYMWINLIEDLWVLYFWNQLKKILYSKAYKYQTNMTVENLLMGYLHF